MPQPRRRTGARCRGHRLPLSTYRPRGSRSGRVLLAGDAQSLINPLTGEGIYTAVVSGRAGGPRRRVRGHGAGGAATGAGCAGSCPGTCGTPRSARGPSRWPALLERVLVAGAGDPALFDDLVEFGLHDGRLTRRMLRAAVPAS